MALTTSRFNVAGVTIGAHANGRIAPQGVRPFSFVVRNALPVPRYALPDRFDVRELAQARIGCHEPRAEGARRGNDEPLFAGQFA